MVERPIENKLNIMSEAKLSPQELKEKFLTELEERITDRLVNGNFTTRFETSSCAPAYGWSVEEYMYMPQVADRLRTKGYTVSSSVNHGVTDWLIGV